MTLAALWSLIQPATLSFAAEANASIGPGIKRLLYVTDNTAKEIKIYDIDRAHRLEREIKIPAASVRGISADAATGRLFFSDDRLNTVFAYDFVHDRMLWQINLKKYGGKYPDRLNVTRDGKAVYVPSKNTDQLFILDASTGALIKKIPLAKNPHNTFVGEQGRYMYCAGRSGGPMYVIDPVTHETVKTIGPFSSPIRPFTVNESETYFFANLTGLSGFAVGDIVSGKIVAEVGQDAPAERRAHPEAFTPLPHGDAPPCHGIAARPGSKEVWTLDDGWGYLYIFDVTVMPPRHIADVPLFSQIAEKVGPAHDRWVSFSIDGKYCYTPTRIIDAATRKIVGQLASSEKLIEIDFKDGVPTCVSGQSGGVYPANNPQE